MKQVFTIIFFVFALLSQAQTFTRVSDINPSGDADFTNGIAFQNKLFFVSTPDGSNYGIYSTDGTLSNTQLVKNTIAAPSDFKESNGKLFFALDDGTHGTELWVSDGTTSGTQLVKDIYSGGQSSISNLYYSITFQGKLYFIATDGSTGHELWVTDGTSGGTILLKDIKSGNGDGLDNYYGTPFAIYNNALFFVADDGMWGKEVWKTDGTTNGTMLLGDFSNQYNDYAELGVFQNKLWIKEGSTGQFTNQIWISDGTFSGTFLLSDSIPFLLNKDQKWLSNQKDGSILLFNNKIVVIVSDTVSYLTDGTSVGSQQLPYSIGQSFSLNSGALNGAVSNGYAYYSYYDGVNFSIAHTDGFTKNLVTNALSGPNADYVATNDKCVFHSSLTYGDEPWVTDGTTSGTFKLYDVCSGTCNGIGSFRSISYNGKLYFEGQKNGNGDLDLWATDATISGTQKLTPSSQTHSDTYLELYHAIVFNGCLYFGANYDNSGYELWKFCDASTGISNVIEFSLNIYPNPASDKLFIETSDLEITEINIYSATGSLVLNEKLSHNSVDISRLMTGVYLAEIKSKETSVKRRFVKM